MIIIIGASKGLGKAIADRLSRSEQMLVLAGRTRDSLQKAVEDLHIPQSRVIIEPVDIASVTSVENFVQQLQTANQRVRALIITAAGFYKGPLLEQSEQSIDQVVATTFSGPLRLITRLIKTVPLADPLDIIDVTSVAAATNLDTSRSSVMHVVTKAALHLFGVTSGRELASRGIRICSIAPGTFAKQDRPGIPVATIVDCIEFVIKLPREAWIESLVIRPTERS